MRRILLPMLGLALTTGAARAQGTLPDPPPAIVQGTVWDSIAGRPLEGARVYLVGTPASTTTGAAGTFRLEHGMEGRYAVAFGGPRLDSLGYVPEPVDAELVRGTPAVVALSIPSVAGIRRALCADADSVGGGAIFGTVTHRTDGAPAAGQEVRLVWDRFETHYAVANMLIRTGGISVRTDEDGRYHVCGVPINHRIRVTYPAGDRTVEAGLSRANTTLPVRYDFTVP